MLNSSGKAGRVNANEHRKQLSRAKYRSQGVPDSQDTACPLGHATMLKVGNAVWQTTGRTNITKPPRYCCQTVWLGPGLEAALVS